MLSYLYAGTGQCPTMASPYPLTQSTPGFRTQRVGMLPAVTLVMGFQPSETDHTLKLLTIFWDRN